MGPFGDGGVLTHRATTLAMCILNHPESKRPLRPAITIPPCSMMFNQKDVLRLNGV